MMPAATRCLGVCSRCRIAGRRCRWGRVELNQPEGGGEASVGQRAPTNTQVVLAPGGDESCTHRRCREHVAVSVMRCPRRRNVQSQKTSHSAGLSHRIASCRIWKCGPPPPPVSNLRLGHAPCDWLPGGFAAMQFHEMRVRSLVGESDRAHEFEMRELVSCGAHFACHAFPSYIPP
jgi:hypothetical protein